MHPLFIYLFIYLFIISIVFEMLHVWLQNRFLPRLHVHLQSTQYKRIVYSAYLHSRDSLGTKLEVIAVTANQIILN